MNNTVRYAAGDWFLVARETSLVLLPQTVPVSLLETVWETLEDGGLSLVIDSLTEAYGMSLSAIPPFAVAIVEDDDLRIAVRGGVRVAYDDGTRQDLITGGRVQTWVEQAIPPYSSLVITPPDARIEEVMLPIASGVVRTGLVTIGTGEVFKPEVIDGRRSRRRSSGDAVAEEDAAETPVSGEPVVAGGEAPVEAEPAVEEPAVAEPVVAEPVFVEPVVAAAPAHAEPVVEDQAEQAPTDEELASEDPAVAEVEEALEEDAVVEAEEIVEEAEAADELADEDAAVDAEAEAEAAAIINAEAESDADASDDEAEAADSDAAEDAPEAADDAADAADDADNGDDAEPSEDELSDSEVDQVFAAIADRELVDAPVVVGDHDGHTLEQSLARASSEEERATAVVEGVVSFDGRAVLSTGRVLNLDRVLVVGRRPRVTRTASGAVPALVTVDSPTHDISRNHLEVRREGESVLVTDLNTTNGTVLLRGADAPRRLHPGEATMVISGDVIDIGDEVTVTFEDLP